MRRRAVAAIAGVAALAVILFAIPLAIVIRRDLRTQALLRLQRDAVAATRAVDQAAAPGDTIELPGGPVRLALYVPSGRRRAGTGPSSADGPVRETLRTGAPSDATPPGRLVTAVPVLLREGLRGAIRAERDDRAVARAARRAWSRLGALGALVVVLAAGAALLLGRRLARPLERLATAARRLGEGDFGVRVPRGGVAESDAIAAALEDTARRLGELITRERAFSADASHQLRTPLAALRLELETIELGGEGGEELARALAEVDRLEATIAALLAVARDAPRPAARADLRALLADLERRWHGPLAEQARPLHVTTPPETGPPQTSAAAAVVEQILEVLLDNACRHGAGAVSVAVREVGEWLAVDVADEGAGLGEDPETMFARRSGSRAGHGIGLALARSLAHAEGGRLSATRAVPPVLTVYLPRA